MASGYVYPTDDGISTVSWRPIYRPMNSSGSSEYSMDNFEIDHNNMQSQRTSPGDKLDMDDDDGSLDSFDDGHSDNNTFVPISRHSPVSDDDLVKIPVRELNQRLQVRYRRESVSLFARQRRTPATSRIACFLTQT